MAQFDEDLFHDLFFLDIQLLKIDDAFPRQHVTHSPRHQFRIRDLERIEPPVCFPVVDLDTSVDIVLAVDEGRNKERNRQEGVETEISHDVLVCVIRLEEDIRNEITLAALYDFAGDRLIDRNAPLSPGLRIVLEGTERNETISIPIEDTNRRPRRVQKRDNLSGSLFENLPPFEVGIDTDDIFDHLDNLLHVG